MTVHRLKCAILAVFASVLASGAAYGAKAIDFTCSGYAGDSVLANFPVLVRLAEGSPASFSYADMLDSTSGAELRFYDEAEHLLPYEIEKWDPHGTSLVWVKVPELSKTATFTMYYGRESEDAVTAADTWSGGYVGVWHMAEANGDVADATGHGLTAVPKGTTTAQVATDGVFGNARVNATSTSKGYLDVAYNSLLDLGDTFTVSGWFKMTGLNSSTPVFGRQLGWYSTDGWTFEMKSSYTDFEVRGSAKTAGAINVGGSIPSAQNAWVHLAVVYKGTDVAVYANSEQVTTGVIDAAKNNKTDLMFGYGNTRSYLYGVFDEFRLMSGTASADWIKAEYDQSNASFLTAKEGVVPTADVFVTLTVPALEHMSVASVTVGKDAVAPEEDGTYRVAKGATVTVEFAVNDGYVLDAKSMRFKAADDMALPAEGRPNAIAVGDVEVVLNEIGASNDEESGIVTVAGGAGLDWIEIRNKSSFDVDLTGWYLTDGPDKERAKWTKVEGNGVVPANGYKVIWADKDFADWGASEAHVAISLSTSGEPLLLAAPDGTAVDSIANFGKQVKGISCGLVGESGAFGYFGTPTPGAANGATAKTAPTPVVTLSEPHGYKTAAFTLTMSCAEDEDAAIYYTTDGTSPTTASTRYDGPIEISRTTVIRAAVADADSVLQEDAAATYLFLPDILAQTAENRPAGFPESGVNGQALVYGMSADITQSADADTQRRLANGFTNTIRTVSLVIDPKHMFDAETGIYVNPSKDGREWERQTMMEQINPTDAEDGFTVSCGIKIRGAFSRGLAYPKHSFHVVFRSEYGASKLEFPLFGKEGAKSFDRIDLRTSQNCSWANTTLKDLQRGLFTLIEDVFSRDTQRDMGQAYNRSRYYNLFINGVYWGLYQTEERVNQYCGETNNGGKEEHYDVVRTSTSYASSTAMPTYTTGTVEGDETAWKAFYDIVHEGFGSTHADNYKRVRGLNPDGTRNPAYPVYLNPESLIDYMLIAHWTANCDTPSAADGKVNNQAAYRNRVDGEGKADGFIWHLHDCEYSLGTYSGPSSQGGTYGTMGYGLNVGDSLASFGPTMINKKLMDDPEYRMLFADRLYRHVFRPDGALSKKNAIARFGARMAELDDAVVCESARWGNGYTREDWLNACNMITNLFMARRDAVLKLGYHDAAYSGKAGWYPAFDPPTVSDASARRLLGGETVDGSVVLSAEESGTVYYTTDGSDPRLEGGTVSDAAVAYAAPLAVPAAGLTVKARLRTSDGDWSALEEVELKGAGAPSALADALRFHSFDGVTPSASADEGEWIVLTNLDQTAGFDLEGVRIRIIKDGDEAAQCDFRVGAGVTVAAGGSVRLDQESCGWTKITNNKIWMTLFAEDGATVVQTSGLVTQKDFPDYYGAGGPGGAAYLQATSFAAETTGADWIAVLPPHEGPVEPTFYAGDYEEPVEIQTPGEYVLSNANFKAGLVLGSGTYILKNTKGTVNTASNVTSTGTVVLKQKGTFALAGTEGTLMTVGNLFVSNGTFKVEYASETAKSIAVNVAGSFAVEDAGTVDVAVGGAQNYGIYLANKNQFCRIGDGGTFKATVNGTKSAALYGNKGSVDAEVESGAKVTATLAGAEARLMNFAGKIKLKGGEVAVTGEATDAKAFKSDKTISVKGDAQVSVDLPGAGSEAFSCADTFTMEGGTVEVVSGDDCVAAETNAVVKGGLFYGRSVGNDVFDTNAGDIMVSGGLVLAYTTAREDDGYGSFGFDVNDNAVNLNGGTVVALGGENLGGHFPEIAGSQPHFADKEAAASKYSGKYVSLTADGTTTTVGLPAIDAAKCTVVMSVPGMVEGRVPTISETAPAKGDIGFHGVYLVRLEPFALGEPTARPSTDYNGSAVKVAFTGDIPEGAAVEAEISVGGVTVAGAVDAETGLVTFDLGGTAVTAGNVYAGTVTVTVGGIAYVKAVTLEQGTFRVDEAADWIRETAATFGSTGTWSGEKAAVEAGAIGVSNATFTAAAAAPGDALVTIASTFDFVAADDSEPDLSARAGIRVVNDGETDRYAVLTAAGLVTNTEVVADLAAPSCVTVTLDNVAQTVAYSVGGVSLGSYAARSAAGGVSSVRYAGETSVASLLGAYRDEYLDTNTATVAGAEYATVADALKAGGGTVRLLWDASWSPEAAGDYTISKDGHALVIGGAFAYEVKDNGDGSVTVSVTEGGTEPEATASGSITIDGTNVWIGVKDIDPDSWYALEKTTDLSVDFAVDKATWAKGAELIAGEKELATEVKAGEDRAFFRVVTSKKEPQD